MFSGLPSGPTRPPLAYSSCSSGLGSVIGARRGRPLVAVSVMLHSVGRSLRTDDAGVRPVTASAPTTQLGPVSQTLPVRQPACPFCNVVDGTADGHVVLDDEVAVAFLDRRPVFKGHVLVVPREHVVTLPDLDPEHVDGLFRRVQVIAAAMPDTLGCDGTFVAINNVVSQSVAHLHVHV